MRLIIWRAICKVVQFFLDWSLAIEIWWIKLLIKLKLKKTYTAEELLKELRK